MYIILLIQKADRLILTNLGLRGIISFPVPLNKPTKNKSYLKKN